jgi:methylglyoxal synthase
MDSFFKNKIKIKVKNYTSGTNRSDQKIKTKITKNLIKYVFVYTHETTIKTILKYYSMISLFSNKMFLKVSY